MTSERVHLWVSRIRGTSGGPDEDVTVEEVVAEVPAAEPPSHLQRIQGHVMAPRSLAIIALIVFAPVVVIVILKTLRDIRYSMG